MRKDILIMGAIVVVVIAALLIGARYYRSSVQSVQRPTATAPAEAPSGQLIRSDSPVLGPADAKVTVVEFYDPECESCALFAPTVKKILNDHKGRIRLVTRYMPLHPNSMLVASFNEAAAEQGKYWEAQDLLFRTQSEWRSNYGASGTAAPPLSELFEKYGKELGLDMQKAKLAIDEKRFDERIARDHKDGISLGVAQTPTFFVNGRMQAGFGEAGLRAMIEDELNK
jgi:protein-disulfide isomerase